MDRPVFRSLSALSSFHSPIRRNYLVIAGIPLRCQSSKPHFGFSNAPVLKNLVINPLSGNQNSNRQFRCQAGPWSAEISPYETLGVENGATEDEIKSAYRKMAKIYHPDVYDGTADLAEGETAESRFIQIQAAYELLSDVEERRKYDNENRQNPMKASQAWAEWVMKKKMAFNQRGDMASASWSEQMRREANLRARNLSKAKIDPEEERRLLEKEKLASMQLFETTMKRHNLVLRKRDLVRKKASKESQKKLVAELLALEGFELEDQD